LIVLSPKEKRFIKYWEEQRTGGRWSFYLLYILPGTLISTIVLSFLVMMLVIGGVDYLIPIAIFSLVLVTVLTIYTWQSNEKQFKQIIRREVDQARLLDEQDGGTTAQ
jgi:Ca2+-dependent lipid-binding protein